jgi:hypothetical protein
MAAGGQHPVAFARINRRMAPSLVHRPFREVMMTMMASHNMEADRGGHTWIAADLEVTHDDLLVGIIGYTTAAVMTHFDPTEWSWLKGTQTVEEGADISTLAPFALDLDERRRWVAFAPTGRLNERTFPGGFQAVLNEALIRQDEVFSDWEVDMVSSGIALRDWVSRHPDVVEMKLTLRLSNPGRDLSADRLAMRNMGSAKLEKRFFPQRNQSLAVGEELDALAEDMAQRIPTSC